MQKFTVDQLEEASEDMAGFCVECGEEAYSVEPDAREYRCEYCERNTVYGAEEIALMGLVA